MRIRSCSYAGRVSAIGNMMRSGGRIGGAALLLCQVAACRSEKKAEAAPSLSEASTAIGPEGGSVRLHLEEGELVVDVPAGAINEPLLITAARRADPPPGAATAVVELGPSGTVFAKPVALRFAIKRGDVAGRIPLALLRAATWADGRWQFLPTQLGADGAIEGLTTHF